MSFFEIFQPGARHQREERDRQNTLVTRPAAGAGGPLGIDLNTGKATFSMPAEPADDAEPEDSEADGIEGLEGPSQDTKSGADAKSGADHQPGDDGELEQAGAGNPGEDVEPRSGTKAPGDLDLRNDANRSDGREPRLDLDGHVGP